MSDHDPTVEYAKMMAMGLAAKFESRISRDKVLNASRARSLEHVEGRKVSGGIF